ncbi:MAG: chromosomal replication initiator protein DnaA [Deferribacteres bacterium]|nr:chromosomal replication initiator protein DnaA [candidate division KSB1 bacterium]MCB9509577.1 chromosomal replication initiator protein DnaA [Deferribacteres bacterium]
MKSAANEAWSRCLSLIKENINDQSFSTWFKPTKATELQSSTLTIQLPSHFYYEWLEDHYSDLINQAVKQVLGDGGKLNYSVAVKHEDHSMQLPSINKRRNNNGATNDNATLNKKYTFDSFVEGSSNQFAKAAALAVSEAPGKTSFNPLVIYGGVGLGKTHLIQAIGNFSLREGTVKRVLYVSSEKFTIEFINSIQNNKSTEFSKIYRNVDLLLVDDIQFFINKERTQEEFFHTFNTLHQNGKQIVLSSDRPPKDITGIEERLLSRFQWGLVADIQSPDLETRIAILQKKAEENGIELPGEVVQLIAYNVTSNIRELEGCLIRLLAHSSLTGNDIDVQLAKRVLKDVISQKKKHITIEDIQKIVSEYYHIPDDLLRAKTRKKEVALVRQIAMYIAKNLTKHSLKTIGLHFGGRDHSTVIHAVSTIESYAKEDQSIYEDIQNITQKIELSSL